VSKAPSLARQNSRSTISQYVIARKTLTILANNPIDGIPAMFENTSVLERLTHIDARQAGPPSIASVRRVMNDVTHPGLPMHSHDRSGAMFVWNGGHPVPPPRALKVKVTDAPESNFCLATSRRPKRGRREPGDRYSR
jgi:hypothetical protein